MSYDIYLRNDAGETLTITDPANGGTHILGGTTDAWLNVTFNYAEFFHFSTLNGMSAKFSIKILEKLVKELGTVRDDDYWASTKGNAGYACNVLLSWARQHPEGHWEVSG